MRWLGVFAFLPCFLTAQLPSLNLNSEYEFATVETTADGAVHGSAFDGLNEILTASGPEDAILLRFRTGLIERWGVQKAVVALHLSNGSTAPEAVSVSAVHAKWTESLKAAPPFERGASVATHELKSGWFTIELPAEVSLKLASGAVASIAISTIDDGTLSVHSRRTGQFMPYLLVRGHGPLLRKP